MILGLRARTPSLEKLWRSCWHVCGRPGKSRVAVHYEQIQSAEAISVSILSLIIGVDPPEISLSTTGDTFQLCFLFPLPVRR